MLVMKDQLLMEPDPDCHSLVIYIAVEGLRVTALNSADDMVINELGVSFPAFFLY